MCIRLFLLGALLTTLTAHAQPHPPLRTVLAGEATWQAIGVGPDGLGLPDGSHVYALAVAPDGSLYVGGDFGPALWAGDLGGVARWTGHAWERTGGGLHGIASALAFSSDGVLYAAGGFTILGRPESGGVARWDGQAWHPLPDPLETTRTVRALVTAPDGTLYAAGSQREWGRPDPMGFVAQWDGEHWRTLGTTTAPPSNGAPPSPGVYLLRVGLDGELYAGGVFDEVEGQPALGLARWDGDAWEAVGAPSRPEGGLAIGSEGTLYAGFQNSEQGHYVAAWKGGQWRPLHHEYPFTSQALEVGADSSLYAVGLLQVAPGRSAGRLMRWGGERWELLDEGVGLPDGQTDPRITALAVSPEGVVYVGGEFSEAGGRPARNVAQWDGQHWDPLGSGTSGELWALATTPEGSVYAGGEFTYIGGRWASRLARWGGDAWAPLGGGVGGWNPSVLALAAGPSGSLYVGGGFTLAGGEPASNIARWDGQAWHPLGLGVGGLVRALVVGPDGSLYAGGSFSTAGGEQAGRIARWDGVQWHPLGQGFENGYVSALALTPDGSLYAAFPLSSVGGDRRRGIARWDGHSWHSVGEGSPGSIRALLIGGDGFLYAAGEAFHDPASPQQPPPPVARWDGENWEFVGAGLSGSAQALTHGLDGSIYAGGRFANEDGPLDSVVRWNGQMWHPIGFGPTDGVRAIVVAPDQALYAGGWFLRAGEIAAPYVARATGLPVSSAPTESTLGALALAPPYPNPTSDAVTLRFTLPEAGPVRLTIYDLLGRELERVVVGVLPAGDHVASPSLRGLPAGVYVVRLAVGAEALSRRLVVLQ